MMTGRAKAGEEEAEGIKAATKDHVLLWRRSIAATNLWSLLPPILQAAIESILVASYLVANDNLEPTVAWRVGAMDA